MDNSRRFSSTCVQNSISQNSRICFCHSFPEGFSRGVCENFAVSGGFLVCCEWEMVGNRVKRRKFTQGAANGVRRAFVARLGPVNVVWSDVIRMNQNFHFRWLRISKICFSSFDIFAGIFQPHCGCQAEAISPGDTLSCKYNFFLCLIS